MKWNGMWVFIGIFLVKLAVGWSNSRYKLILTVGSNFGSNFTIRFSYNHWKHSIALG